MNDLDYRLASHAPLPDPRFGTPAMRWLSLLMAPIIWFLPAIILTGIFAIVSGLVFVPYGFILAPFGTMFTIFAIDRWIRRRRRRNGQVILTYLEAAVRLNFPLPAFLEAAEISEPRRRRRQIQAVRFALQSGLPVAAALQAAVDVDEDAIATIAAHEGLGQLRAGLASLDEQAARQDAPGHERQGESEGYRFYPLFLMVVIAIFAAAYAIFVLPKMREIFQDFKMPPPPVTNFVLHATALIDDQPWIGFVLLAALGIVLLIPLSIWLQRIFISFWALPRFGDWLARLAWHTWPARAFQIDRAMGQTCQLLAQAAAAGITLPAALDHALRLPVNPGFKDRLHQFRVNLLAGQDAADAARHAGMPALLVGMLAPLSAGGQGGAEMFAFLARYYQQKFSRAMILLRAALEPALVLFAGALVLILALALITPIVALLQQTMKDGGLL